jgi:hypothetical protein
VAQAALDQSSRIYMLGFDMGPTKDNLFNNLYAGTEFYKPQHFPQVFVGNWVKQLIQIAKDFPTTNFIRLTGPTTASIIELEKLTNFDHQDLALFVDSINTIQKV